MANALLNIRMISFHEIYGHLGDVCFHGKHDMKLPLLCTIFACNYNKFVAFNADSFLFKKVKSVDGWWVYTFFLYS